MANRHSAVLLHQQHSHRLSYDIASANHNTLLPFDGMTAALNQFDNARRGAGKESLSACVEIAHVYGMETIHILLRVDGKNNLSFINLLWHRHLHQNPMNVLIRVQLGDQLQKCFLRCLPRQHMGNRANPDCLTRLFLVIHIYLRGGIIADQNNR